QDADPTPKLLVLVSYYAGRPTPPPGGHGQVGDYPSIRMVLHRATIRWRHASTFAELVAYRWSGSESLDVAELREVVANAPDLPRLPRPAALSATRTVTKEEYCARVRQALSHIRKGDVYQVQIGHEILVRSPEHSFIVYRRLRETNPAPYMFHIS